MFENWGEFYLLAGSAAAVLIGLIFVVVTLMSDRPRSSVLYGSKLYMGPIVLGVSFQFALVAAVVALWGLARGGLSIAGIRRLERSDEIHWTDAWFYGVLPSGLYVALAGVAWAFWKGWPGAPYALAAVVTGLLFAAVRNEWDLVTWLAPRGDKDGEE